jgi:Histidine kinase-, DNA gyrase B-, and HSP90-like ATPase
MNAAMPVLTSIRSEWNAIHDFPVIGKDVLELLSSSMYVNPLAIFREYVQNSADSIDEAVGLGLLRKSSEGRVEIRIDPQNRTISIRDNGTGIPKNEFARRLIALGASRKRGTKARGFRGVGRLAGLGYCQELIFRSRADGEREVSELRWDCRRLKAILRDAQFTDDVADLVKQVVRVRKLLDPISPERFFEVQLVGIVRHGSDLLVNAPAVESYLSQVAPLPFSPEFKFGLAIEDSLASFGVASQLRVFMNESETPVYRPHRNTFAARKGFVDSFTDLEIFQIDGTGEIPAAIGWLAHHDYHGAIPAEAKISGLRLRIGNMQIGEADLLNTLFHEPRFNSWVVGETHVLDERILPNGRRDQFEQSVHFNDLTNRLLPKANDLVRRCRSSSIQRNFIRQFDFASIKVEQAVAVLKQGALSRDRVKQIRVEINNGLLRLEKLSFSKALDSSQNADLTRKLAKIKENAMKILAQKGQHSKLAGLKPRERGIYEDVFSLIYDCSSNRASAKSLVDQILKRLE